MNREEVLELLKEKKRAKKKLNKEIKSLQKELDIVSEVSASDWEALKEIMQENDGVMQGFLIIVNKVD